MAIQIPTLFPGRLSGGAPRLGSNDTSRGGGQDASLAQSFSLSHTGLYPSTLRKYLAQDPALTEFYGKFPLGASELISQMKLRAGYPAAQRETLATDWQDQYTRDLGEKYEGQDVIAKQLDLLQKDTTYTVTTGHQLVLYTGELYFIYKIASTIALACELNNAQSENHVIPVYWMSTEDHDYDEIATLHIDTEAYTWLTDERGPVGSYRPQTIAELMWLACKKLGAIVTVRALA
jgi:bacillithiol synthase